MSNNKNLIAEARAYAHATDSTAREYLRALADALEKAESGHDPAPFVFPFDTRVTIVGMGSGVLFESYKAWDGGAELHQQDQGRTLKLFPKQY